MIEKREKNLKERERRENGKKRERIE